MDRELHTERLLLSAITLEDASFMFTLMNSPGYLTFIGNRNVNTIAETEKYLEGFYTQGF